MPYTLTFKKQVKPDISTEYINECCIGGDAVLEYLLPKLSNIYGDLYPTQEDWGWFSRFQLGDVKLAVDVSTQEVDSGEFQINLTSRKSGRFFGAKIEDTQELEDLKQSVVQALGAWPVAELHVELVDKNYR